MTSCRPRPCRAVVALLALGLLAPAFSTAATKEKERPLAYRLTAGQTFGYHVEIRVENGPRHERFVGTPVFTVREVDAQRNKAVLVAIGRLASYTISPYTKQERPQPSNDVWVGTKIVLELKGRGVSGYGDYHAESLPDSLLVLPGLKRLFFVDLPDTTPGAIEKSGHRTVHLDSSSSRVTRKFQGQETYSVRSEAASANVVRVEKRHAYVVTNKSKPIEFRYQGTTLFDRRRGLPISTEATGTQTEGDGRITTTVTVRLLDGDYLAQAVARSKDDWKDLPRELDPAEFRRVQLHVKDLPRLRSSADAQPGMVVGYLHPRTWDWYLAEVVQVISTREIKIRYRGSLEEGNAEPGQLGIIPAKLVPKP